MNLPEGAIPIEQWKPDPLKLVTILAEILGRQEGCVFEVVPAHKSVEVDAVPAPRPDKDSA